MPSTLSPQEFVAKWRSSNLRENAAYVEHFIDLCHLVNHEGILARLLALNLARAAGQGDSVSSSDDDGGSDD